MSPTSNEGSIRKESSNNGVVDHMLLCPRDRLSDKNSSLDIHISGEAHHQPSLFSHRDSLNLVPFNQ